MTRTAVFLFSVLAMQATLSSTEAADIVPPQKIDRDSPEMAWWRESMKTRDQRLQWWRDARFGMFVHWGVYSELGGTWQGKPLGGYSEHIQRRLKIPIPEYREKVAGSFNPTKFDADEWIRLAKAAGMDYFVITAKHHDGFAMYDGDLVVGGLKSSVSGAYLMSDSSRSRLKVTRASELDLAIDVPREAPDASDSIVVVRCDGPLVCDDVRLLSTTQTNTLRAFDGKLVGETIRFGPGKKDSDTVDQWSAPGDAVTWTVRLAQPATFEVLALYDAAETSAGGKYQMKTDNGATIAATISAGKSRSDSLGTMKLDAGTQSIRVIPETIAGEELMRLRGIRLVPKAE